jgi:hypothetical protein
VGATVGFFVVTDGDPVGVRVVGISVGDIVGNAGATVGSSVVGAKLVGAFDVVGVVGPVGNLVGDLVAAGNAAVRM